MQRHKFHTRLCSATELVSSYMYISELWSIAEYCKFGSTFNLMLHDNLVCGIQDDATQCRLLAEPDLTFAKPLQNAQVMEVALKDVKELRFESRHQPSMDVHKVLPDRGGMKGKAEEQFRKKGMPSTCGRCGKPGHSPVTCSLQKQTTKATQVQPCG